MAIFNHFPIRKDLGNIIHLKQLFITAWLFQVPVSMFISLSQWLNFKLSGMTCLVGKIKFKLLFQGPFAE